MPGKNSSTVVANETFAFSRVCTYTLRNACTSVPCTHTILVALRASVTNVSRGKRALELVSTRLNWISLKILSIRTMTFRRIVSFPHSRMAITKLFNENYSLFPGKRDCAAATFFPVFLFILYVKSRRNIEIAFFSQLIAMSQLK